MGLGDEVDRMWAERGAGLIFTSSGEAGGVIMFLSAWSMFFRCSDYLW